MKDAEDRCNLLTVASYAGNAEISCYHPKGIEGSDYLAPSGGRKHVFTSSEETEMLGRRRDLVSADSGR